MDKRVTDLLGHDRANRGKFIFDPISEISFQRGWWIVMQLVAPFVHDMSFVSRTRSFARLEFRSIRPVMRLVLSLWFR